MNNKIQSRFTELDILAKEVAESARESPTSTLTFVDDHIYSKWLTKTENLIFNVCGEKSSYFHSFSSEKSKNYGTNYRKFQKLLAIFIAIKEDYESGYLTSYKSIIQAELFDSELEQAKALLGAGYFIAAAVIAGTVLETTLRELCEKNSLPLGKANKMNDDLAKAGVYNTLQQKQILALADIRNSAAHGKVDEFTRNDVSNMINSIEAFLITHLN